MNKTDIAIRVADKTGIPKKLANEAVEEFIDSIRQALSKGEKISLVGFGTFMVKNRKPMLKRMPVMRLIFMAAQSFSVK